MRSLIKLLEQKYGKNTITIFRKWEKMEAKVSDFKNHQRFSLRCLSKGVIPNQFVVKELDKYPERRRHYSKGREAIIK